MKSNRNYGLLLASQFLSAFGDNALLVIILGPLTFLRESGRITSEQVNDANAWYSALFFFPFVLLAPLAGFLNDRYPKTSWLLGGNLVKLIGTGVSGIGVIAGSSWQSIGYGLVGIGACLYSPAKYGILPEILPSARLVKANGAVEMLTLAAILSGLWAGAKLVDQLTVLSCHEIVLGIYAGSLLLNVVMVRTPCNPAIGLRTSAGEFIRNLRQLLGHRRLGRILLGSGIFWFSGATLRTDLQSWGLEILREARVSDINNVDLALLKIWLALGIIAGSLLAGRLHRVGDLRGTQWYGWLMGVCILLLGLVGEAASMVIIDSALVIAGLSAGLFVIPLNAALQAESDPSKLGKTIATQNFVDYLAMLLGAGLVFGLTTINFNASEIFLALAVLVALAVTVLRIPKKEAVSPSPEKSEPRPSTGAGRLPLPGGGGKSRARVIAHFERATKSILRVVLRRLYGFRTYNAEALDTSGPLLLVPNHVSLLDWLFLAVWLEEDWLFVTSKVTAQASWLHRLVLINRHTFPIDAFSPFAIKRMAEHLRANGRLVLFAEGRISTTGALMKLYDGTGFLLHKTRARVVTCFLRGAGRLPWVRHSGWTRWFPRISAHFSDVLIPPEAGQASTAQARAKLSLWLRDRLVEQQFHVEMELGEPTVFAAIMETARQHPDRVALEDQSRRPLSYRRLQMAAGLMASQWERRLRDETERVGILLPNVNATPVTILSLWARGKVPSMLNYSTGWASLVDCTRLAGLRQIITSRNFLARLKLLPESFERAGLELIYLEDVRASLTSRQKMVVWLRAFFGRGAAGHRAVSAEQPALVLFTSGSEGSPKGVELTHGNLMANIRQVLAVTDIADRDRLFNALPLFHSFGLTVGALLPLVRGLYVFLYPSPLHYRMVPAIVYDSDCTIFLSTNTFLKGYARRANAYDFRAVRYLVAGAEKLQENTVNEWARQFGIRVLEGYGATECSPCLSVNTPLVMRYGSAGRFLPGIEYKLEPVEGVTDGGRLLVRGPNIMRRYLNADADAKFQALGGWYDTGDLVRVDEDGFVEVLGRLKRFAKVSGEMVSLAAIEEALAGAFVRYGLRCQVAVLSRPDEEKGEALIAITNEPRLRLDEIRSALRQRGFSNLCVPREIRAIREIPRLGTGKINHRELANWYGMGAK
ncbi:MAG: MFS transporter [Candidatus Omnitrophica bacterium]|nr:MFS transporter [Candidatus Omnitrophota bacterium]